MAIPKYENLPGVFVLKNDGGLAPEGTSSAPRCLVLGTAEKGIGSQPFLVRTTSLAKAEFGVAGTLLRGMYEAKKQGAQEIVLYRIGATAASLTGVGGDYVAGTGYTITTIMEDSSAGSTYSIWYEDSEDRLVVFNVNTGLVVYDNNPEDPIERFEVVVSGYRDNAGGGPDVGTLSAPLSMFDAGSSIPTNWYVGGTNGTDLSRMRLYEKLHEAYNLLQEYAFDVMIPMDVYADDWNTVGQGSNKKAPESDNGANTYPTAGDFSPGASVDSLGMCYVEEIEGRFYFWWKFDTSGATADIWPSVGSSSATEKSDGTALAEADFHEVNFAYQLGRFLFEYSTNNVDATGVLGVKPFNSYSLSDIAKWIGKEPSYTINTNTGEAYVGSVDDNGTGLLGFKFMAGMYDYRDGEYGGGFVARTSQWLDEGNELSDDNGWPIDLGKFISVVVDWPILTNDFSLAANSGGYIASFAPSYGGFYSMLPPNSAPTNKRVLNTVLFYKIGVQRMDALAGRGYVVLREKPQGVVIADAPTASLPLSDYKRLSTVRIVKDVVDAVREALDPFIGEGTSDATRAAMHSAVDQVLLRAKQAKFLTAYRGFEIIQTPDMAVQGKAEVHLVLVPAFELRQITVTVSLAKE